MIVLIGVGHVFNISAQVRSIIEAERPDAVCVELDPPRYQALVEPTIASTCPAMLACSPIRLVTRSNTPFVYCQALPDSC